MLTGHLKVEQPTHGFFTLRVEGAKIRCEWYHNVKQGETVAWVKGMKDSLRATATLHQDVDKWDGKFGYELVKLRLKKFLLDRFYTDSLKYFVRIQKRMAQINLQKAKVAEDINILHNAKYPR